MARRRTSSTYPWFFAYTVFAVIAELLKFSLVIRYQNTEIYFYVYWGAEAAYALLGFAAIHEVFNRVFENFASLRWFRFLLPAMGLIMLVVALMIPALHRAVEVDPWLESIFSLQILVRCLQLG